MNQQPIIEIFELEKELGNRRVLRGITFEVSAGQRLFLTGANGSGKSTLLRIVAGLSAPTKGSLRIFGHDYRKHGRQIRENLLYLSHETFFYLNLSAMENLDFFLQMLSANNSRLQVSTRRQRQEKIEKALSRCGLFFDRHKKIDELSLGMRHRLAMAKLDLFDARLILLDEAHTGLDQQGEELLDQILDEKMMDASETGQVIVEATHRLAVARRYLEQGSHIRILRLENGLLQPERQ